MATKRKAKTEVVFEVQWRADASDAWKADERLFTDRLRALRYAHTEVRLYRYAHRIVRVERTVVEEVKP